MNEPPIHNSIISRSAINTKMNVGCRRAQGTNKLVPLAPSRNFTRELIKSETSGEHSLAPAVAGYTTRGITFKLYRWSECAQYPPGDAFTPGYTFTSMFNLPWKERDRIGDFSRDENARGQSGFRIWRISRRESPATAYSGGITHNFCFSYEATFPTFPGSLARALLARYLVRGKRFTELFPPHIARLYLQRLCALPLLLFLLRLWERCKSVSLKRAYCIGK